MLVSLTRKVSVLLYVFVVRIVNHSHELDHRLVEHVELLPA